MSLAQKLILYALVVALLPLAAIGFSLVRVGESALRERIQEHQLTASVAVAAKVSQAVEALAQHVSTMVERFDVAALSAQEREGLLRLLYRQSNDITATQLVDGQGRVLAPPVHRRPQEESLSQHLPMTPADVARFTRNIPAVGATAAVGTVLMSPAYFPPSGAARVAMAIPCGTSSAQPGAPLAVAALEVALRDEVLRLEGVDTGPQSTIFVVDREGRAIVHPRRAVGEDLRHHGAVGAFLSSGGRGAVRYQFNGTTRAAAFAPVGQLGWGVVVEQPERVAFASALQMRRQVLGWMVGTTLTVLLTGLWFASRLRRTFATLVGGARAFGEGKLQQRIELTARDETGELAHTMNTMAAQLHRSLLELEEWSRTLEQRVEERTEELKQAQAQLLTQSKLAAIGQLGAGVAHEVNNPLAGILGYTQILLRKCPEGDPARPMLLKIEEAAKRCKAITVNLLRFSERGLAGRMPTQLNHVAAEVLETFRTPLEETGIEVVQELDPELPTIVANSGQVALVLINLLSNAKNAMPEGGRLRVKTRHHPGGAELHVQDTGHGIAPEHLARIFEPFFTTKTVWTGVGLGLSVAYRIVTDHGGQLEVESAPGGGTTMKVVLPYEPPPEALLEGAGAQAVLLE